jgi:hypothetical protein
LPGEVSYLKLAIGLENQSFVNPLNGYEKAL